MPLLDNQLQMLNIMAQATRTRDTMIGFRVTSELKKRLEELAEADNRPLSNYLEHVLKAHADAAMADKIVPQSQFGGTQKTPKPRK